jgi:hypothetical protein
MRQIPFEDAGTLWFYLEDAAVHCSRAKLLIVA